MNQSFGNRHRHKGYLLKSNAEYSFALMLDRLQQAGEVVEWLYEPTKFWFEGIRAGTTSYRPDFYVIWAGDAEHIYYEIKRGNIQQKDITKYKRLAKRYPDVVLVLVVPKIPQGRSKSAIRMRILLDKANEYVDHIWEVGDDYRKLGIPTRF